MIEMFKDFIPVSVYTNSSGVDCSNNGISSRYRTLYLCKPDTTESEVLEYCESHDSNPACFFKRGGKYIRAEHICQPKKGGWYMFGGNFMYSSDARFTTFGCNSQPLPIMDRME